MRIRLLALVCLALAAPAVAEGRAARSCRKWAEERSLAEGKADMNKIPVLISKAWFLGYLRGRGELAGGFDDESIFLWLDNYCRDHPADDLAGAGLALQRELKPAKGGSR